MSAVISLRVLDRTGLPVRGAKYELLELDGTAFGVIQREQNDDGAVVIHFPVDAETVTVRASKDEWSQTRTFGRTKVQFDFELGLHSGKREHLVILIHGIRTHAFWYDRLKHIFEAEAGVHVEGVKYGRFDVARFIIPGPWRRGPIEKTKNKIRPLVVEANRLGRKITVIAHSNGTQIATAILREDPLFEIDNLVMCGSVVDDNFNWGIVKARVRGRIVNDYGARDVWPTIARSFTWGYGHSGTVGFGAPVEDRIHNTGHSDYFSDDFVRNYWLPLVTDNLLMKSPVPPGDGVWRPWWFVILELPWRWIVPMAIILAFIWMLLSPDNKIE